MGACLLTVCYVIHWQAYGYQDDDSIDYVNEIVLKHGRYPTTSLPCGGTRPDDSVVAAAAT